MVKSLNFMDLFPDPWRIRGSFEITILQEKMALDWDLGHDFIQLLYLLFFL